MTIFPEASDRSHFASSGTVHKETPDPGAAARTGEGYSGRILQRIIYFRRNCNGRCHRPLPKRPDKRAQSLDPPDPIPLAKILNRYSLIQFCSVQVNEPNRGNRFVPTVTRNNATTRVLITWPSRFVVFFAPPPFPHPRFPHSPPPRQLAPLPTPQGYTPAPAPPSDPPSRSRAAAQDP